MGRCEVGGEWHHYLGDDGGCADEKAEDFEDGDVGGDGESYGQRGG